MNNLAHDLAYAATLESMRSRMMAQLREEQDPRVLGEAAVFDTYAYAGPRTKGYDTWLREQEERMTGAKSGAAPAPGEKKAKKKKAEGEI